MHTPCTYNIRLNLSHVLELFLERLGYSSHSRRILILSCSMAVLHKIALREKAYERLTVHSMDYSVIYTDVFANI